MIRAQTRVPGVFLASTPRSQSVTLYVGGRCRAPSPGYACQRPERAVPPGGQYCHIRQYQWIFLVTLPASATLNAQSSAAIVPVFADRARQGVDDTRPTPS